MDNEKTYNFLAEQSRLLYLLSYSFRYKTDILTMLMKYQIYHITHSCYLQLKQLFSLPIIRLAHDISSNLHVSAWHTPVRKIYCKDLHQMNRKCFFLPCHYTNTIHYLTQSFAVSLYTIRSAREHICCNTGHSKRWSIIWSYSFHSHVVSPSSIYFHFFVLCLLRPIFVLNLLSHFHFNQVPNAPLARDLLGVCISL